MKGSTHLSLVMGLIIKYIGEFNSCFQLPIRVFDSNSPPPSMCTTIFEGRMLFPGVLELLDKD